MPVEMAETNARDLVCRCGMPNGHACSWTIDHRPYFCLHPLYHLVHAGSNGPTITLIRDKKGHVFGGFAAEPWERHGTFYGIYPWPSHCILAACTAFGHYWHYMILRSLAWPTRPRHTAQFPVLSCVVIRALQVASCSSPLIGNRRNTAAMKLQQGSLCLILGR